MNVPPEMIAFLRPSIEGDVVDQAKKAVTYYKAALAHQVGALTMEQCATMDPEAKMLAEIMVNAMKGRTPPRASQSGRTFRKAFASLWICTSARPAPPSSPRATG